MRIAHTSSRPERNRPTEVPRSRPLGQWLRRMALVGLTLLLVLAGLIWLAGTWAQTNLAKQYPPPGQLIDIGGYKLHLDCRGQGSPPVLLEAGLNDFSVQWARVQPAVAAFTQVCAYDRAGLGWSDPSPYPRANATMVKEPHTLLANAELTGPYVLVGHSFGGINLRRFAHQYPEQVRGLVLVDSAHEAQMVRLPVLHGAVAQLTQQFQLLSLLNRWGVLALSPAQIPNRGLPADALVQYRARLAGSGYFEAAIAESAAFAANSGGLSTPQLASLGDLPLIVLSRGQPAPLPGLSVSENGQYEQSWHSLQAELAGLSSHSQQWVAEQSGHDIHLQQSELVVEAVRELVETSRQGDK